MARMYLRLVRPDGTKLFGEDVLNAYYDFRAKREREFRPDVDTADLLAEKERASDLERLRAEDANGIRVSEALTSTMCSAMDFDEIDPGTPYTTNSDVEMVLDVLRDAKEALRGRDDYDTNWETTFDARRFALCEFALANDELGVVVDH